MRMPKNATERLALRQSFITKDARCVLEHTNGSAAYVYETAGKLYAITFWGTAAKPCDHYRYSTEDRRNEAIWKFRESVEQSLKLRADMKAKRAADVCTLQVGDIVNTSWGYDQTNVDFFVVTRVTQYRAWVRPIAQDYEATGFLCGKCWPKMPIETCGDEFMVHANGKSCLIDGHHASLTTGDQYSSSYA